MGNFVYIATSMDGYIAAPDGNLDWLDCVPNPQDDDLGFYAFMDRVDAVVMGRVTFETVAGFGMGWHYPKPGIILSSTLGSVPEPFADKVEVASGTPPHIVELADQRGYQNLYIDGGETIQRFLRADLIDEMIITEIPILLGGGVPLFTAMDAAKRFELVSTEVLLDHLVKKHWRRRADLDPVA